MAALLATTAGRRHHSPVSGGGGLGASSDAGLGGGGVWPPESPKETTWGGFSCVLPGVFFLKMFYQGSCFYRLLVHNIQVENHESA